MAALELKDLCVLVADKDMYRTVEALLQRPEALKINQITSYILKHPYHDGGCRSDAAAQLRSFAERYRYALVMFDRYGCGHEHLDREEIQQNVEADLARTGWRGRAKAIVIDPELEAWVWSQSSEVDGALGWAGGRENLRKALQDKGFLSAGAPKPAHPKEAVEFALTAKKRKRSSEIFETLAKNVSVRGCTDPAFNEFTATLQAWFPRQRAGSGMVVRERAPAYEAQVSARAVG